jgi:hypothetical protein
MVTQVNAERGRRSKAGGGADNGAGRGVPGGGIAGWITAHLRSVHGPHACELTVSLNDRHGPCQPAYSRRYGRAAGSSSTTGSAHTGQRL